MMIIKNREAVVEQLTEMLVQFAKDMNAYDTDVYAYYNKDTQEVELDTFVNPGGNSWLNDDHYTIYTDDQHHEDVFDSYDNEGDLLAAATNDDKEEAKKVEKAIAEELEIEVDEVDYSDIRDYIKNNEKYYDNLTNAYNDLVEEMRAEYAQQAEDIITRFEEETEI